MKTIIVEKYICEICGHVYDSRVEAEKCEERPMPPTSLPIGSKVRIMSGDGAGKTAIVRAIKLLPLDWGGCRYWHTWVYTADLIGDWGTRDLTWDAFEKFE